MGRWRVRCLDIAEAVAQQLQSFAPWEVDERGPGSKRKPAISLRGRDVDGGTTPVARLQLGSKSIGRSLLVRVGVRLEWVERTVESWGGAKAVDTASRMLTGAWNVRGVYTSPEGVGQVVGDVSEAIDGVGSAWIRKIASDRRALEDAIRRSNPVLDSVTRLAALDRERWGNRKRIRDLAAREILRWDPKALGAGGSVDELRAVVQSGIDKLDLPP